MVLGSIRLLENSRQSMSYAYPVESASSFAMKYCPVCWRNGRALDVAECLCNGKVLKPSAFHAAMGKRLIPLPAKHLDAPKEQERVFKAPRLVFGDKPQKPTRRNAQTK